MSDELPPPPPGITLVSPQEFLDRRDVPSYCEACGYTESHDPNCPRPLCMTSTFGHDAKKPSPEECCRIIYVFMREHEKIHRKAPHMNLCRSEWNRLKKLARMGMAK